jgi:hypothetical protein
MGQVTTVSKKKKKKKKELCKLTSPIATTGGSFFFDAILFLNPAAGRGRTHSDLYKKMFHGSA